MHYIIMSNLLLQFTQFIHYPLLPLVFYHFIVLYISGCIYIVYFNSFFVNFIVCISQLQLFVTAIHNKRMYIVTVSSAPILFHVKSTNCFATENRNG